MMKSEMTVTMPLNTYEELTGYKEKYWELRKKIKELLKPSKATGIDYIFNVEEAIKFIKETCVIPNTADIEITSNKVK